MSTSYGSTSPGDDRAAPRDQHVPEHAAEPTAAHVGRERESVVEREKEEYGGVKIGAAFFGWLAATGMAVILTALAAAAGAVFGLTTAESAADAADQATQNPETIGIVGGIILLAVLFVAYYCGGYVAGRMARFDGAKQGVAVWVWAVVVAIVLALLGLVAGSQFNVLAELNSFPQIPVSTRDLTTGGVIALVAAAVVTLGGAVLGGLAGMRFHRKVDRAGLGH
ncbi:DUF4153 domain-containing protein [Cellulosimicrobium sp. NPDC057127]|uniref:DUF4153 domain-containing protein n=1 Tax=Cellulosimicrobium sp. NPDC057127 TaxID=3346026 RepID=UPI00362B2A50